MKVKFQTPVTVSKAGFYQGSKGVALNFSESEGKYDILLAHNVVRSFYPSELKLVAKPKKVRK